MHKFFLISGLLLISLPALAGWTLFSDDKDQLAEYDQYVDMSTLKRSGNAVKGWSLFDYRSEKTSGALKYRSSMTFMSINCETDEVTVQEISRYSDQMGHGERLDTVGPFPSKPIPPGSVMKGFEEIYCHKHK